MGYPNVIPKDCHYWRHQGDHKMIGCEITGALCSDDCDIERTDPTGVLRERIDKKKRGLEYNHDIRTPWQLRGK